MFMFLGFRTQHINIWPLANRSGDPPSPSSHRTKLFMFMCLFFPDFWRVSNSIFQLEIVFWVHHRKGGESPKSFFWVLCVCTFWTCAWAFLWERQRNIFTGLSQDFLAILFMSFASSRKANASKKRNTTTFWPPSGSGTIPAKMFCFRVVFSGSSSWRIRIVQK